MCLKCLLPDGNVTNITRISDFGSIRVLFFGLFQLAVLKLSRRTLSKMLVGLAYTYIGLVLFMTGVNVGFMPAGNYLGQILGSSSNPWLLIPIAMVMGFFIVKAEPAVYVLNKQVEEITDGAISSAAMGASLSIGVAASIGLAMVRGTPSRM